MTQHSKDLVWKHDLILKHYYVEPDEWNAGLESWKYSDDVLSILVEPCEGLFYCELIYNATLSGLPDIVEDSCVTKEEAIASVFQQLKQKYFRQVRSLVGNLETLTNYS